MRKVICVALLKRDLHTKAGWLRKSNPICLWICLIIWLQIIPYLITFQQLKILIRPLAFKHSTLLSVFLCVCVCVHARGQDFYQERFFVGINFTVQETKQTLSKMDDMQWENIVCYTCFCQTCCLKDFSCGVCRVCIFNYSRFWRINYREMVHLVDLTVLLIQM